MEDGEFFKAAQEIEQTEGIKFIVVRVSPGEKKGYVGELPASEMTMENVKKNFGPGKYRIRAQGPHGFVAGGGTVTVAEFVQLPQAVVPATPGMGPNYFEIQRAFDERQHARMIQMLTILAPVLGTIFGNKSSMDIPALITALKPAPAPGLGELTTALANLRAVSGERGGGSDMDKMIQMAEFIKSMQSGDRETTWIDAIKDVAAPLVDKITGGSMGQRIPLLPRRPPPPMPPQVMTPGNPAPVVHPPEPPQVQENPGMLGLVNYLREQLDGLIVQASRNKNPELYAELLLDNLPEGLQPSQLVSMLERADWWPILSNFHAGVAPYAEWFGRLREHVLDFIKNPQDETPDDKGNENEPG